MIVKWVSPLALGNKMVSALQRHLAKYIPFTSEIQVASILNFYSLWFSLLFHHLDIYPSTLLYCLVSPDLNWYTNWIILHKFVHDFSQIILRFIHVDGYRLHSFISLMNNIALYEYCITYLSIILLMNFGVASRFCCFDNVHGLLLFA